MKELESKYILIVDDDEEDHHLIRESIAEVGGDEHIMSAFNGEEALRLLDQMKQSPPSLIILDYNMPGMTGIEVLEKIKKLYDIPVMMHTTSCTEQLILEVRAKGALDCVPKCTCHRDIIKIGRMIRHLIHMKQNI